MSDLIEQYRNQWIQHGPDNDRIYLMDLKLDSTEELFPLLEGLDDLARDRGYGKIFARAPRNRLKGFLEKGYRWEGIVRGLYGGREDGVFLSRYLDTERRRDSHRIRRLDVLSEANRLRTREKPLPDPLLQIRRMQPGDAKAMAALYRKVFDSYPFPILEPGYLRKTIEEGNTRYYGAVLEGELVALSSAETDRTHRCAEMTDFATLPEVRGRSLARRLLHRMEEDLAEEGILTFYTIARALSPGINRVFARSGYRYGGTLINNTQIGGGIESMNVWSRTQQAGQE